MTFGDLAIIGLAGLAGPLVATGSRFKVPVVVGEIAAGIVLGRTGLRVVSPDTPFAQFMAQAGFAVLMLVVGMNLPLRTPGLRRAARTGAFAFIVGLLFAVPIALLLSSLLGIGRAAPLIVVLAACSASTTLPILRDADLPAELLLAASAWVIAADAGMIIALPIVLHPSQAPGIAAGAAIVTATAAATLYASRKAHELDFVRQMRASSRARGWALDLRMALLGLFAMCFLAQRFSLSVLVAGFSGGIVLALLGDTKRLFVQLQGVGEGFLIPLFFVILGSRLQLRAMLAEPRYLVLAGALVCALIVIRVATAGLLRLRPAVGLLATAQMGVPAAVVSIGLSTHSLSPGAAAAIMTAAVTTLGISTVGVLLLACSRHQPATGPPLTMPPAGIELTAT